MFGGDNRLETLSELIFIADVVEGEAAYLFEDFEGFVGGDLIAVENIADVESLLEQELSLAEELACEDDDEISAIAYLFFLHFSGHHNHACGGMVHFHFLDDGGCVASDELLFELVYDHFIHA